MGSNGSTPRAPKDVSRAPIATRSKPKIKAKNGPQSGVSAQTLIPPNPLPPSRPPPPVPLRETGSSTLGRHTHTFTPANAAARSAPLKDATSSKAAATATQAQALSVSLQEEARVYKKYIGRFAYTPDRETPDRVCEEYTRLLGYGLFWMEAVEAQKPVHNAFGIAFEKSIDQIAAQRYSRDNDGYFRDFANLYRAMKEVYGYAINKETAHSLLVKFDLYQACDLRDHGNYYSLYIAVMAMLWVLFEQPSRPDRKLTLLAKSTIHFRGLGNPRFLEKYIYDKMVQYDGFDRLLAHTFKNDLVRKFGKKG